MPSKAVLFVRVSKEDQDYNRQIDDLNRYAQTKGLEVVDVISEKITGVAENSKRPAIKNLLQKAIKGEFDTICITEVTRLGRKPLEIQKLIEELSQLKVCIFIQSYDLRTLDESGNRTPFVDFLISLLLHMGEMERDFLQKRVKSGLERARKEGKTLGRPKGVTKTNTDILKKYSKVVRDIKAGISVRKVEQIHKISHTTINKIKKAMADQKPESK